MYLQYKIIALITLLGALLGFHYYDKHTAVVKAIEDTTLSLTKQYDKKVDEAREKAKATQIAIETASQQAIKDKDDKIKTINTQLASALVSLRTRPSRTSSSDTPGNKEATASCTGRELFKEDGEFLTREAARADAIVEERNYYYQEYESLRSKLEELKNNGNK